MIESIDHIVITCKDINKTIDFYTKLGMKHTQFSQGRNALEFGNQKINLHIAGHEFEPKAQNPVPGSQDLCFVISIPIQQAQDKLSKHRIEIIEGPVQRTGAKGQINSVYVRDPDGNLVELSTYNG
ncbi:Glyoxalase/Bleomycin resistance protein/Dihydroxybiphenyl dioxygenase [Meira miltonrushii]|uniref:Glyoxalase/Bleomycin resistance protein/Dihydroxybiphenyl dioxygenase n=1 Tax=Meira miltonrushii TaxID=1280837 RepID=A0A316VFS2_9BASI|nr:Glyoxalase/Bleomycin resistance protein/Dihydroxybiphenyl dioxygenase [Meira miltonrushii]PWN36432.1 Glyoxalase/Bleomycin resistance protein/Dihydroxybiphenyl dioxygenase [Meira miltonrushii]